MHIKRAYIPTVIYVGNDKAFMYSPEGYTWKYDAMKELYKRVAKEIREFSDDGKTEDEIEAEIDKVKAEIKKNEGRPVAWRFDGGMIVFSVEMTYMHDSQKEFDEKRKAEEKNHE